MLALFDSGLGGLTILRELHHKLPQYDYLYLGDTARAPYGRRSPDEIFEFTTQGVDWLFNHGAELIILACNTSSANALRRIQREILPARYPDKRVLGIIVPTVEQVTGANWRHINPITTPISDERFTVGIIGTKATIDSGVFAAEVHNRNQSITVIQQACPNLAELIEAGASTEDITAELTPCLTNLQNQTDHLHAVLLGCTHYELIADQIKQLLPDSTKLYHQPSIITESLRTYLDYHPEIEEQLKRFSSSHPSLFTTGDPTAASLAATRYIGERVNFKQTQI